MKSYRTAFAFALLINVLLALGLGFVWIHSHRMEPPKMKSPQPAQLSATAEVTHVHGNEMALPAEEPEAAPLADIQLTPRRLQSIGVKTSTVAVKDVMDDLRTTGNVEADEKLRTYVQVRFPGWIRKVYADAVYQYVRKGQPLFTVYSPDLVATQKEYLLARQNRDLLKDSSIQGVAHGSNALLQAAKERLQQWDVPASEIAQLESSVKAITDLTIHSPANGFITEKNILPNMYVEPGTHMYTLADLSRVWVYAQVFQNEIGKLSPGDPATITVDAYPGKTFPGRVQQILPEVDMATRTVRVRLVLPNPGLKLKPGMYVNVSLLTPLGRHMVIPDSAVFQSGTRQIVFVDMGEGTLQPHDVRLGARVDGEYIVLAGLKAGDSVVTAANFLIDSESQLQSALGAFTPPPPGAGAAAAMNAGEASATAGFSSDPSPPQKGMNQFRVRLTDSNGAPVAGADVSVIFFMPAMPAMGMAAMKTSVTLTDTGNGNYEGRGELGSGGTWQVTVTARKDLKTIAHKQFSISATGGM